MSEVVKASHETIPEHRGLRAKNLTTGSEYYPGSTSDNSFLSPLKFRLAEAASRESMYGLFNGPDVESMQKMNESINSNENYLATIRRHPLTRKYHSIPNVLQKANPKKTKSHRKRKGIPSLSVLPNSSHTASRYHITGEQLVSFEKSDPVDALGLSNLRGSYLLGPR